MYILYYFNQDYDCIDKDIIGIGSHEKLENKKQQLIQQSQDKLNRYKELQEAESENWKRFYPIKLAFWTKYKHAINNPNRKDGLWLQDIIIKAAKYNFKPSGYSGMPDCDFENEVGTIVLPQTAIDEIRNKQVEWLSYSMGKVKSSYYIGLRYIDMSKILEPIPEYETLSEYKNFRLGIIYTAENLIIEEVQEI